MRALGRIILAWTLGSGTLLGCASVGTLDRSYVDVPPDWPSPEPQSHPSYIGGRTTVM